MITAFFSNKKDVKQNNKSLIGTVVNIVEIQRLVENLVLPFHH